MIAPRQRPPRRLDADGRGRAEEVFPLARPLAHEAHRRCRGRVPLDELLGEAALALAAAAAHFDPSRGVPLGAYATLVARRHLLHFVAAWGAPGPVPLTDLGRGGRPSEVPCPRSAEPWRRAADREALGDVEKALPSRSFRLLELCYAEGHTMGEAALMLGISKARVAQILLQALAQARACLRRKGFSL